MKISLPSRISRLSAALLALVSPTLALALEVGDAAPKVSAEVTDADGKAVDLAKAFAEGYTLVYFYPKADTPGCTKQGCSVRDNKARLTEAGVRVIGVSADSAADQKAFDKKFTLGFTLLADTGGDVIKAFGVPTMAKGMPQRQAFLVHEGKVVWKNEKVAPTEMVDEVLAEVAKTK